MLLVTLESSLHAGYLQVQITKPEVIHSFLWFLYRLFYISLYKLSMFITRVQAASMSS